MNINELRVRIQAGEKFDLEFFWKGPFSQWAKIGFTVDGLHYKTAEHWMMAVRVGCPWVSGVGVHYKTAEHWMMAEKARIFGDEETRKKIIESEHPKQAKALGREVKNFNEEKWVSERYSVVYAGNKHKFTQNDDYKAVLLGTGDRILVEASPEDRIWGIGLAEDHPDALDPLKWKGLNVLGFVLTDLRNNLRG
jgi:ribA/ribD-fused uncharacterized protein